MKTTKEIRARAMRLASAVDAGYKPERGEIEELAATLIDCAEMFKMQKPIIDAVKSMINKDGSWTQRWSYAYDNQLVPAVRALYAFEGREEGA